MAISKNNRFLKVELNKTLKSSGNKFPLDEFEFQDIKLKLLGKSNKTDLAPVIENNSLLYAASVGRMGQYIYSDYKGNIYDAYIYEDEVKNNVLYGIKTRS